MKIANLKVLHLYLAPPLGVNPLEFRWDLWHQKTRGHQKTRVRGLSYGIVCVILCLAILVQHRRKLDGHMDKQTHGQTDRQRHNDSIDHASIASRGNKWTGVHYSPGACNRASRSTVIYPNISVTKHAQWPTIRKKQKTKIGSGKQGTNQAESWKCNGNYKLWESNLIFRWLESVLRHSWSSDRRVIWHIRQASLSK